MDAEIRQQLLALDDYFLEASNQDFSVFEKHFQKLSDAILSAIDQNLLSPDTIALAHSTSQSIAILSEAFLHLHEEEDKATQAFKDDVERISNVVESSPGPVASQRPDFGLPHLPAAHEWLVANLHNPYPSKAVKAAIARSSQSSPTVVDKWFRDVRRMTGWQGLCKKRFHGKKSDMIDAATRFFIAPDPERPLDIDCQSNFTAFVAFVHQLYAVSPRPSKSPEPPNCRTLVSYNDASATCYPSPVSSPGSAIVHLDDEDTRRTGSSNSSTAPVIIPEMGYQQDVVYNPLDVVFPPSPASSVGTPILDKATEPPPTGIQLPSIRKRKRRLSDSGLQEGRPPRPVRQRSQVVSESFLQDAFNPRLFDSWFQDLGSSPPSMGSYAEEPSPDPLQVELFDFSTLEFPSHLSILPTHHLTSAPQTPIDRPLVDLALSIEPEPISQYAAKDITLDFASLPNTSQEPIFFTLPFDSPVPELFIDNLFNFPSVCTYSSDVGGIWTSDLSLSSLPYS